MVARIQGRSVDIWSRKQYKIYQYISINSSALNYQNNCFTAYLCQSLHDERREYSCTTKNTWAFKSNHDHAICASCTRAFTGGKDIQPISAVDSWLTCKNDKGLDCNLTLCFLLYLVGLLGVEPSTNGLWVRCSNQAWARGPETS